MNFFDLSDEDDDLDLFRLPVYDGVNFNMQEMIDNIPGLRWEDDDDYDDELFGGELYNDSFDDDDDDDDDYDFLGPNGINGDDPHGVDFMQCIFHRLKDSEATLKRLRFHADDGTRCRMPFVLPGDVSVDEGNSTSLGSGESYEALMRLVEELDLLFKTWRRRLDHPYTAHLDRTRSSLETAHHPGHSLSLKANDVASPEVAADMAAGHNRRQPPPDVEDFAHNEALTAKKYCQSARVFYEVFASDAEAEEFQELLVELRQVVYEDGIKAFVSSCFPQFEDMVPYELWERIWRLSSEPYLLDEDFLLRRTRFHGGPLSDGADAAALDRLRLLERERVTDLFAAAANLHVLMVEILFKNPRLLKVPLFARVMAMSRHEPNVSHARLLFDKCVKVTKTSFERYKVLKVLTGEECQLRHDGEDSKKNSSPDSSTTTTTTVISPGEAMERLEKGVFDMEKPHMVPYYGFNPKLSLWKRGQQQQQRVTTTAKASSSSGEGGPVDDSKSAGGPSRKRPNFHGNFVCSKLRLHNMKDYALYRPVVVRSDVESDYVAVLGGKNSKTENSNACVILWDLVKRSRVAMIDIDQPILDIFYACPQIDRLELFCLFDNSVFTFIKCASEKVKVDDGDDSPPSGAESKKRSSSDTEAGSKSVPYCELRQWSWTSKASSDDSDDPDDAMMYLNSRDSKSFRIEIPCADRLAALRKEVRPGPKISSWPEMSLRTTRLSCGTLVHIVGQFAPKAGHSSFTFLEEVDDDAGGGFRILDKIIFEEALDGDYDEVKRNVRVAVRMLAVKGNRGAFLSEYLGGELLLYDLDTRTQLWSVSFKELCLDPRNEACLEAGDSDTLHHDCSYWMAFDSDPRSNHFVILSNWDRKFHRLYRYDGDEASPGTPELVSSDTWHYFSKSIPDVLHPSSIRIAGMLRLHRGILYVSPIEHKSDTVNLVAYNLIVSNDPKSGKTPTPIVTISSYNDAVLSGWNIHNRRIFAMPDTGVWACTDTKTFFQHTSYNLLNTIKFLHFTSGGKALVLGMGGLDYVQFNFYNDRSHSLTQAAVEVAQREASRLHTLALMDRDVELRISGIDSESSLGGLTEIMNREGHLMTAEYGRLISAAKAKYVGTGARLRGQIHSMPKPHYGFVVADKAVIDDDESDKGCDDKAIYLGEIFVHHSGVRNASDSLYACKGALIEFSVCLDPGRESLQAVDVDVVQMPQKGRRGAGKGGNQKPKHPRKFFGQGPAAGPQERRDDGVNKGARRRQGPEGGAPEQRGRGGQRRGRRANRPPRGANGFWRQNGDRNGPGEQQEMESGGAHHQAGRGENSRGGGGGSRRRTWRGRGQQRGGRGRGRGSRQEGGQEV